jgi:hypothetical protein
MQADLPHTLYSHDRKKEGGKGPDNYKYNPNDPAIAKTLESIRKRKERMEKEGKDVQYTMDEIFNRQ